MPILIANVSTFFVQPPLEDQFETDQGEHDNFNEQSLSAWKWRNTYEKGHELKFLQLESKVKIYAREGEESICRKAKCVEMSLQCKIKQVCRRR